MKKILIINNIDYHYEILESLFTKFLKKIDTEKDYQIYMFVKANIEYKKYITSKYKNVLFLDNIDSIIFDLEIYATIYPKDIKCIDTSNISKKYYISHRVDKDLQKFPNVYFLTPLCLSDNYIIPTVLPGIKKNKTRIPIFCIQGNISEKRRNYKSLIPIFEKYENRTFRIKFLGKGKIPFYLEKYKNKIIIENNHNFINYHDAFKDVYIILALIDDTFEHNYFTIQLTSSISYSISYDIPILIHSKLNDIYEKDIKNSIVYKDQNEMNIQFRKLLNKFYDEK